MVIKCGGKKRIFIRKCEVAAIIGRKKNYTRIGKSKAGEFCYLVAFKGYALDKAIWQHREDLLSDDNPSVNEMVENFDKLFSFTSDPINFKEDLKKIYSPNYIL